MIQSDTKLPRKLINGKSPLTDNQDAFWALLIPDDTNNTWQKIYWIILIFDIRQYLYDTEWYLTIDIREYMDCSLMQPACLVQVE